MHRTSKSFCLVKFNTKSRHLNDVKTYLLGNLLLLVSWECRECIKFRANEKWNSSLIRAISNVTEWYPENMNTPCWILEPGGTIPSPNLALTFEKDRTWIESPLHRYRQAAACWRTLAGHPNPILRMWWWYAGQKSFSPWSWRLWSNSLRWQSVTQEITGPHLVSGYNLHQSCLLHIWPWGSSCQSVNLQPSQLWWLRYSSLRCSPALDVGFDHWGQRLKMKMSKS